MTFLLQPKLCNVLAENSMTVAWIYIFIAGILEAGFIVGLKYSEGFTKLIPSILTVIVMVASFKLMMMSMRSIPAGTAYAVWTGIGAVSVTIIGIFVFGESKNFARILSIFFIVAGVIGLKVFTPNQA